VTVDLVVFLVAVVGFISAAGAAVILAADWWADR
jgi:hypothetical protein